MAKFLLLLGFIVMVLVSTFIVPNEAIAIANPITKNWNFAGIKSSSPAAMKNGNHSGACKGGRGGGSTTPAPEPDV